jgi:hypothetical protein
MGAVVTCPNGEKFGVKTINYVLKRWQEVTCFSVGESSQPFSQCRLQVHISNGRVFETHFPTFSVVAEFF